jgi:enterochelin esterase-like enzyme
MYNRLARLMTALLVIVLTAHCAAPAEVDDPSSGLVTQPTPRQPLPVTAVVPPLRTNPLPTVVPTLPPTTLQASRTAPPSPALRTETPGGATVQTVTRSWTPEELLTRKTKEGAPVWAEGDELTFVYQGEADEVQVCCGIQRPMQQVQDTDLWVLTVRVRNLPQAVISYGFMAVRNGQLIGNTANFVVWRGAQAPPPVQRASLLRGQIKQYTLHSGALGEQRELTVYLPPDHTSTHPSAVIYTADGQSVPEFAAVLEPLITDGRLPSILLVGVHSPTGPFPNPSQDLRAHEYLPEEQPTRFAAHERFFVEEVAAWAERELAAPTDRQQRAVFGYSNGGVFAAAMGIRHPDRYGHILAFSLGVQPGTVTRARELSSDFYLVAGTLEEGFHSTTALFAQMLQSRDIVHIFRERVCGHDYMMWQEEFPAAVVWAFRRR